MAVDQLNATTVSVQHLSVSYDTIRGPVVGVGDFSLEARSGDRVAVVGESGSGKTTACMALAGLLPAAAHVEADRASIAGTDILARKHTAIPRRVPDVSVVFQNAMTALDAVWSVESQLVAVIRGRTRMTAAAARREAAEWVGKVGLRDVQRVLRSRPYELSGGMRQRVMIALAVCAQPKVLIADEPTSALDMTLSRELMDLIVALTDELGTTLLMISHDIGLCRAYTDWTVVMSGGQVVEQGPSARIIAHPEHEYTRALVECMPTLAHRNADRLPAMAGPA